MRTGLIWRWFWLRVRAWGVSQEVVRGLRRVKLKHKRRLHPAYDRAWAQNQKRESLHIFLTLLGLDSVDLSEKHSHHAKRMPCTRLAYTVWVCSNKNLKTAKRAFCFRPNCGLEIRKNLVPILRFQGLRDQSPHHQHPELLYESLLAGYQYVFIYLTLCSHPDMSDGGVTLIGQSGWNFPTCSAVDADLSVIITLPSVGLRQFTTSMRFLVHQSDEIYPENRDDHWNVEAIIYNEVCRRTDLILDGRFKVVHSVWKWQDVSN